MRDMLKILLISMLLAATGATSAMQFDSGVDGLAGSNVQPHAAELATNQSGGPTLAEAVERVRRQYDGQIVSAKTEVRGKQEVHVIRVLLKDGKVKNVNINGRRLP